VPGLAQSMPIQCLFRHPSQILNPVLNGGTPRAANTGQIPPTAKKATHLSGSFVMVGSKRPSPSAKAENSLHAKNVRETDEMVQWFLQKSCGSAENITRFHSTLHDMSMTKRLAKIKAPVSVLHSENEPVAPEQRPTAGVSQKG
jgi:hypothetical protein